MEGDILLFFRHFNLFFYGIFYLVILMKRSFIFIAMAIIIGFILAGIVLICISFEVHSLEIVDMYVLQAGVYDKYQNAVKKRDSVEGIIYKYNNQYLVLKGVSLTENGINKISGCLSQKYYKKRLNVVSNDVSKIRKYQSILDVTTDEDSILYLNKKILALVGDL